MHQKKKEHPKEKSKLHPRNRHRERYDFKTLTVACPALASFVHPNKYGDESIDFFDPAAVKMLNKALLLHHYGIENWDIPDGYLCPPVPGRADYIHYVADLLGQYFDGTPPLGQQVRCLDIGVGANCIYPIIGVQEYGWTFVGAEIDSKAIRSAEQVIGSNPSLKGQVEIRKQPDPNKIFDGIIQEGERFALTVCNPPFHASFAVAQMGTVRKLKNLKQQRIDKPILNFGGQNKELWCEGGEKKFVQDMILESKKSARDCLWFTTLVSKESNLKGINKALKRAEVAEIKTIQMGQGNKKSRIVAWTFLTPKQQKHWMK